MRDPAMSPRMVIGEWLHHHIVRDCTVDTQSWVTERVSRVVERLSPAAPRLRSLRVVVPWMDEITAFTAPGSYVYVTRALMERLPDDETTAFVIAHEVAHHELGHVEAIPEWLAALGVAPAGALAVAAYRAVERRCNGPEKEREADFRALETCLRAGYDGERCLDVFRILEHAALDRHDADIVFGPDPLRPGPSAAGWVEKAGEWMWERGRGYPSLRTRRDALIELLPRAGLTRRAA